ncbi:MAG TPA: Dyp-type peroxidase [Acidimicrobiales bacterium]
MHDEGEAEDEGRASIPASSNGLSRRGFLASVGGAAVGAGAFAAGLKLASSDAPVVGGSYRNATESFYGSGPQGGIVTSAQSNTYFASLDVSTEKRRDLEDLLRSWSDAAADLAVGRLVSPAPFGARSAEPDSMEVIGLGSARLTVTFGLGPGIFEVDGVDRFGLRARRPAALVDLPTFPFDELIAQKTGGDLTIQACADDPQVAFHAVRELLRMAEGVASIRWTQVGFNETPASTGTPRNLQGFKDGTINPAGAQLEEFVWAGAESPRWMRGGTYLVVRRIHIAIEDWDTRSVSEQEQVIGRHKVSGAPLGESAEFDALDLDATDSDGNPLIAVNAHVRLASPKENRGQMILRRGYSYNDGVSAAVGTNPPAYDAGLLFFSYQRDPRKGFIPIFQTLAQNDALSQFTVHTGSLIVAVPPAALGPGHYVGESLFS